VQGYISGAHSIAQHMDSNVTLVAKITIFHRAIYATTTKILEVLITTNRKMTLNKSLGTPELWISFS